MIFNSWQCLLIVVLKTSMVISYDEEDPHTDPAFPIYKDYHQKFLKKDAMNNSEIQKSYQKLNKQYGMNKNVELEKFKSDVAFYLNQSMDVRKTLTIPTMKWENYFKHVPTIDMKDIFNNMPTMNYDDLFHNFDKSDIYGRNTKKQEDLPPGEAVWQIIAAILSRGRARHVTLNEFIFVLSICIGFVLLGSLVVFCMKFFCPNCCRKKIQGAELLIGDSSRETLGGQQQLV